MIERRRTRVFTGYARNGIRLLQIGAVLVFLFANIAMFMETQLKTRFQWISNGGSNLDPDCTLLGFHSSLILFLSNFVVLQIHFSKTQKLGYSKWASLCATIINSAACIYLRYLGYTPTLPLFACLCVSVATCVAFLAADLDDPVVDSDPKRRLILSLPMYLRAILLASPILLLRVCFDKDVIRQAKIGSTGKNATELFPEKKTTNFVVFVDLECPFSQEFFKFLVLHSVSRDRIIVRHFPLKSHPYAYDEAIGAELARINNRFWEFVIEKSENPQVPAESNLVKLGWTPQTISRVLSASTDPQTAVSNDLQLGVALGVNSTPTVFAYDNSRFRHVNMQYCTRTLTAK